MAEQSEFEARPQWLSSVVYNEHGLVPCIVQDRTTGEVLMMAWMNEASLHRTLDTRQTWFWSRSRNELWNKGATSGNVQEVESIHLDCDGDTLLCLVDQVGGGACHLGTPTCWDTPAGAPSRNTGGAPRQILAELLRIVHQRAVDQPEGSYTASLIRGGVDRAGKKVGEEAVETVIAAKNALATGDFDELANETADLLFHLLVLLECTEIDHRLIVDALKARR